MSGIRRAGWSVLASAVVALLVVVLLPVRAGAAGESLSFNPAEGPPNSAVAWVAGGFVDCPPVDDAVPNGVVILRWDGKDELGRATVSADDGSAASSFLVPESAKLAEHDVTATCEGDSGMVAVNQFGVTPPVAVQVIVPKVVGSSEPEARAALEAEKFPVEVTGQGEVVTSQDPPGGTLVDPGRVVTVVLGDKPPATVEVPRLIDLRLDAARKKVTQAGLELGGISGDRAGVVTDQNPGPGQEVLKGAIVSVSLAPVSKPFVLVPDLVGEALKDVPGILVDGGLTLGLVSGTVDPKNTDDVVSQQPLAGSTVPRDSEVNVSVQGVTPPPVKVPDVVGDDAADARSTLAAVGLVPTGSEGSTGEVADEQPPAGTLVPLGSTVSLVLKPQTPWPLLVVAALVALGAAVAGARGPLSRSLDRRWVRTHLDIRPGGRAQEASVTDAEAAESALTQVVRLVPRHDPETHVLQEKER